MENGLPAIRNFSPKEYGAHAQNWSVVQDKRGVIYVGNTAGILEYDGVKWRILVPKDGNKVVFSLSVDSNNRIYYGSYNELGYLSPDSAGNFRFVSLLEKLPPQYRKCLNVWNAHASKNGIYFKTPKYVFLFRNGEFKIWETSTVFRRSFLADEKFFVYQDKVGLMKIEGDSLTLLIKTGALKNKRVLFVVPYDKKRLLLGTAGGFYLFNKSGNKNDSLFQLKLSAGEESLIEKSKISGGLILSDGNIAVPSYNNGLLVFNKQGALLSMIDKSSGLTDQKILAAFADNQNGLWLATNNGIARIEYPSPFSYYKETSGVEGTVLTIVKHKETIYAGTSQGIFYLNKKSGASQFKKIEGADFICWKLLSLGEELLAATDDGIYEIDKTKKVQNKIYDQRSFCLTRSEIDSDRAFIGLYNGAASIYYDKKRGWISEGKLDGFNERVRFIAGDEFGNLWLCTSYNGVWRISFSNEDKKQSGKIWEGVEITKFDTSDGLPSLKKNRVFSIGNNAVFSAVDGIYRFNDATNQFEKRKEYQLSPAGDNWNIFRVAGESLNNLLMVLADRFYEIGLSQRKTNGEYEWKSYTYERFFDSQINAILPEEGGSLWFGGSAGLVQFDAAVKKNYAAPYKALVRNVIVKGDSSVYAGAGNLADNLSVYEKEEPVLDYENNSLRFEFAAVSFDVNETNRFQYFLEGFDKGWSDWSDETKKDYTNVPEGKYKFRVRARNIYSRVSLEDAFSFEILPPFYRTVWAYFLYSAAFVFLFVAGVNWRTRKHFKEKETLENLIAERTKEVKEQAEKLKEMDKLKSRFFANISHEFRTPLTLIIDPVDQMISGKFKGDLKAQYGMINRNARKLLGLINQLLCLSKLESGAMTLNAVRRDIVPILKGVLNSFESSANAKNIKFEFISKRNTIKLNFDVNKMEQIIVNLISNAIKFTPAGGKISVAVNDSENNFVRISVKDDGVGIPEDRIENIFDRFFQVDSSQARKYEGTGIGLALTKELVELHRGTISVKSRIDKGSEFIFDIPTNLPASENPEEFREASADYVAQGIIDAEIYERGKKTAEAEVKKIRKLKKEKTISKILIVEDNNDVRNYLKSYLEDDYEITEAFNGAEGIKAAVNEIPDLIVSDVMMPILDGYELCENLKKDMRTSHIPIILLTAKAEDIDKITGLKTGADDYLIKPFNSEELLTRINNLIEQRKKLQEKYKKEISFSFNAADPDDESLSVDERFLKKAFAIIETNIAESAFSVDDFSKELFMSRVNLYRKLKALINQTPSEFIRTVRLKRAAQLLKQNAGNITEITFQTGFTSTAYFSKRFREQYGLTPSEFLKKKNQSL
ncbi:MAG: response regulator [Chlorobi bacterium]|nr:response regulator [Chlorobiota bacterium]